jgi:hypothetical protein
MCVCLHSLLRNYGRKYDWKIEWGKETVVKPYQQTDNTGEAVIVYSTEYI